MAFGNEKQTIYFDVNRESGRLQYKPEGSEKFKEVDFISGAFTGIWTKEFVSKKGETHQWLRVRLEDEKHSIVFTMFKDSTIAQNLINCVATIDKPFNANLWIKTYRGEDYVKDDGTIIPTYKIILQSNKQRLEWLYPVTLLKKNREERDEQMYNLYKRIKDKMMQSSSYKEPEEMTAEEEQSYLTNNLSDDVPF